MMPEMRPSGSRVKAYNTKSSRGNLILWGPPVPGLPRFYRGCNYRCGCRLRNRDPWAPFAPSTKKGCLELLRVLS